MIASKTELGSTNWMSPVESFQVSSSSISFNKKLSSLHPKKLKDYHSRYETRPLFYQFYRKTTVKTPKQPQRYIVVAIS